MYSRIICVSILVISTLGYVISDKNVTKETKSKRGVQGVGDPGEISVLPPQHIGTFTQIRTLTPDETPYVDLTYKSLEGGINNHYVSLTAEQQKFATDNAYDAQTFQPQQLNYEALLQNPQQFFQPQTLQNLPLYGTPITLPQQYAASSNYISAPYPITFNNKISPLAPYGTQKSLQLQAGQLKRNNPLKLPSYTSPVAAYPGLYGNQDASSALKFIQPSNLQYNLPIQAHNTPQPIKYIQPYHTKLPYKVLNSQPQFRPAGLSHPQIPSSPILQISQNYKALEPSFFEQQGYDAPVAPQFQQFVPSQQSPFENFNKPVQPAVANKNTFTPSPQVTTQKYQRIQEDDQEEDEEDEEDDDDEIVNRKHQDERHEINDEDDFNKGYRETSRGFPGHDCNHDGQSSARYRNVEYDDSSEGGNYHRRPPYHYDEHRDTEGHYSDKHQKKEPRYQGHSHRESYKYNKKGETDVYHKKPYKQYAKKYKTSSGTSQSQQKDSKYASDTSRGQTVKTPSRTFAKQSSSTPVAVKVAVKSSTEPTYQYGFEPMKTPYTLTSQNMEDQDGKYSSNNPVVKNKIYRENSWYVSKTTNV